MQTSPRSKQNPVLSHPRWWIPCLWLGGSACAASSTTTPPSLEQAHLPVSTVETAASDSPCSCSEPRARELPPLTADRAKVPPRRSPLLPVLGDLVLTEDCFVPAARGQTRVLGMQALEGGAEPFDVFGEFFCPGMEPQRTLLLLLAYPESWEVEARCTAVQFATCEALHYRAVAAARPGLVHHGPSLPAWASMDETADGLGEPKPMTYHTRFGAFDYVAEHRRDGSMRFLRDGHEVPLIDSVVTRFYPRSFVVADDRLLMVTRQAVFALTPDGPEWLEELPVFHTTPLRPRLPGDLPEREN